MEYLERGLIETLLLSLVLCIILMLGCTALLLAAYWLVPQNQKNDANKSMILKPHPKLKKSTKSLSRANNLTRNHSFGPLHPNLA